MKERVYVALNIYENKHCTAIASTHSTSTERNLCFMMVTKRVGRIQAFKHHHIVPSFFYFLSLSFFAVIRWLECVHCLMCKAQFLIRLTVQQRKKFAVRAPRQRSRSCKKSAAKCELIISLRCVECAMLRQAKISRENVQRKFETIFRVPDKFIVEDQHQSTGWDFSLSSILLTNSSFFSHASVRNT